MLRSAWFALLFVVAIVMAARVDNMLEKQSVAIDQVKGLAKVQKHQKQNDTCVDPEGVPLVVLAGMSDVVYQLHISQYITGSTPEIDTSGFKVAEQVQQPDFQLGGAFIPALAVWTRETPCKQAVVSIKGTSPGSATDLRADAKRIVGGVQPTEAKAYIKQFLDKYKADGYTVLVTGHSLGGYMGEIISTTFNVPGAVFCAPGPNSPINQHDGPFENPNFHNINANHDPFGNVLPGYFSHKQWSIYVEDHNTHSIDAMVDKMRLLPPDATNINIITCCADSELTGYRLNLKSLA